MNDVNYIKIIFNDENNIPNCIKAGVRDISRSIIYASAKFEEDISITTPKYVELGIITDTGLYKAHSELKRVIKEPPYTFFEVKTPESLEFSQNREFFRVRMNENATISYTSNGQEKQIACETYDISANGVRLIVDSLIDIPDVAKITLHMPDKDLITESKLVRTDNDDNTLKVSYHYTFIKESDLDYISKICLKKQLENRKKFI